MSEKAKNPVAGQRTNLADAIEHRAKPKLNEVLSKEEKEEVLLPGVVTEGSVAIDTVLQVGMTIIERADGALECLDIHFNRAVSRDGGRTWGEYSTIEDLAQQGTFGKKEKSTFGFGWTRLPSGRIGTGWIDRGITPEGHPYTHLWWRTSDDEGQSWCRAEDDIFGWLHRGWLNCVAFDEPAVEELQDGRLLLVGRSTVGRLLYSISEDRGEHWSIVEPLPLASSYSPGVLRKIPNTGDIMCVWNQVSPDEIRRGCQRGRLSAAITSDGVTWKHFRTLERHGRLDAADRIVPEDSLLTCRALDDVGDIPADRGTADYATIAFHDGHAIIMYPQCRGIAHDLVSAMKIRVLALEWFYAAP